MYTMEHYPVFKKKGNSSICDNIDGSGEHYTKCNKLNKEKYYMISLICGILLKTEWRETKSKIMVARAQELGK